MLQLSSNSTVHKHVACLTGQQSERIHQIQTKDISYHTRLPLQHIAKTARLAVQSQSRDRKIRKFKFPFIIIVIILHISNVSCKTAVTAFDMTASNSVLSLSSELALCMARTLIYGSMTFSITALALKCARNRVFYSISVAYFVIQQRQFR